MNSDLQPLGEFLGGVAALVAVCVTIWQYFAVKRQKEFELATRLIAEFDRDELLRFSVTCVDWAAGMIPTPKDWLPIVGHPVITHDISLFHEALRVDLTLKVANDPKGMLYRHAFVALFNHLERLQFYVDLHAVRKEDLISLSWLARELWSWRYAGSFAYDSHGFFMEAAEKWYDSGTPKRLIEVLMTLKIKARR
jgi:hypothetical protein